MTITIDIDASFTHASAIYTPRDIKPDPTPRYAIMVPPHPEFANCRFNASGNHNAWSNKPPFIMVGDGSSRDELAWAILCERASNWRVPLDTLLIGRPLKVACKIWTPNEPFATGHDAIILIGIQILGDLSKSELLDTKIAEIKAWFNEGDDE
jgi:hypothetical protein